MPFGTTAATTPPRRKSFDSLPQTHPSQIGETGWSSRAIVHPEPWHRPNTETAGGHHRIWLWRLSWAIKSLKTCWISWILRDERWSLVASDISYHVPHFTPRSTPHSPAGELKSDSEISPLAVMFCCASSCLYVHEKLSASEFEFRGTTGIPRRRHRYNSQ